MPVDKIEREKSQGSRRETWQEAVTDLSLFQIDSIPDDRDEPAVELSLSKSFDGDGSKEWDKKVDMSARHLFRLADRFLLRTDGVILMSKRIRWRTTVSGFVEFATPRDTLSRYELSMTHNA
jgi:hypothetical protein